MSREEEKRLAAEAAAELVEDGMRVGLGTGSTVAFLVQALAKRRIRVEFVATSPRTADLARSLGMVIEPFDAFDRLDLAIDGADQLATDGWLIKGGGGAHTREKIVAAAAKRYVVIVDSSKIVNVLHAPVPVEIQSFGLAATLRHLDPTRRRAGDLSPDGGVIADYWGEIGNPVDLAERLSGTPGLIAHGLFAPALVTDVLVGIGKTVKRSTTGGMS